MRHFRWWDQGQGRSFLIRMAFHWYPLSRSGRFNQRLSSIQIRWESHWKSYPSHRWLVERYRRLREQLRIPSCLTTRWKWRGGQELRSQTPYPLSWRYSPTITRYQQSWPPIPQGRCWRKLLPRCSKGRGQEPPLTLGLSCLRIHRHPIHGKHCTIAYL